MENEETRTRQGATTDKEVRPKGENRAGMETNTRKLDHNTENEQNSQRSPTVLSPLSGAILRPKVLPYGKRFAVLPRSSRLHDARKKEI